jgi:hypothetical protein
MSFHELLNRLNALLEVLTAPDQIAPKGVVEHLISAKTATIKAITLKEDMERAQHQYAEQRYEDRFGKSGIDVS